MGVFARYVCFGRGKETASALLDLALEGVIVPEMTEQANETAAISAAIDSVNQLLR